MRTKPLVHPQVALGLPVCILWLPSLLGYGGLAPVALAAVIALAGCALLHAWPTPSSSPRWPSVVLGCIEVIIAGTVGASIAPMLNHLGTVTAMCIGAGIWVAGLTLFRVAIHPLLLTALPLFLALLGMLYAITTLGMGWTLLEPHWHTWSVVQGGVTVGLLLGASCGQAGTGISPLLTVYGPVWVSAYTTLMCCVLMASEWGPPSLLLSLCAANWPGWRDERLHRFTGGANRGCLDGALLDGSQGRALSRFLFGGRFFACLSLLDVCHDEPQPRWPFCHGSCRAGCGGRIMAWAPGSAVDASIVGIAVVLVFWIVASRATREARMSPLPLWPLVMRGSP